MMVLGYNKDKALTITTVAHHVGKAILIDGGDLEYLMTIQEIFTNEGLTTTLE
jgi:ATP-dependent Clp protease adapter protein ClpS